jgi:choline transporter-like protein 2/4/5
MVFCCSNKVGADDGVAHSTSYEKVNRKCHDVLFLVIFVAFWLGMFAIAGAGVSAGDPERLIFASDFQGQTCGAKAYKDKPLVYYPRMNQDLIEASQRGTSPVDTKLYGICVSKCPSRNDYICNYDQYKSDGTYAGKDSQKTAVAKDIFSKGPCWYVGVDTTPTIFRCIPKQQSNTNTTKWCSTPDGLVRNKTATDKNGNPYYNAVTGNPTAYCETVYFERSSSGYEQGQENPLFEKLRSVAALFSSWAGDIQTTVSPIAICGLVLPLVLGLAFLVMLRYCAGCMVWTVIYCVIVLCAACSFGLSVKAGMIGTGTFATTPLAGYSASLATQTQNDNQTIYEIVAWVCIVLTLVLFVTICFMRHKVKVCIGVIREASRCMACFPQLLVWPIVPSLAFFALFAYWLVVGAYVASSSSTSLVSYANDVVGNATASTSFSFTSVDSSNVTTYLGLYHLFGLLWTNQLIQAISICTIAGTVNKYYWARDKSQLTGKPIRIALYNALRYHMGSLVFGSLIVAIVQMIRIILAYIDHKTQKLQQSNIVIKLAMKCVQCCMWCMEKCLKYISKTAYIMIAMKGGSFCSSTRQAVGLLWANLAQIGLANTVVSFMLLLAELVIVLASSLVFYLIIDRDESYAMGGPNELSTPMIPVLVVALVAWFVSDKFMGLFGCVVDSTLLMFCVDKKENKGTAEGYFMSDELARLLGEKRSSSTASAKQEKVAKSAGAGAGAGAGD